jgi:translation initiation factor 2-alpha kinase 4
LQELTTDVKTLLTQPFLTKKYTDDKIITSENELSSVLSTNKCSVIKTAAAASTSEDISMIEDSSQENGEVEKFNDFPKDSRLNTEFQVIGKVGSGAFGVVLKVKNRIDMCTYAIKRIRLNPSNDLLNKQITREIKLLSRLNHENVVRYYSTWMEKHEIDASSETTEDTTEVSKTPTANKIKKKHINKNKSSSFSNLLLKQSNLNMIEATDNNISNDDDFSSFNQKVTTLAISSSSDESSSCSLESSSNDDDDDDDKSSISFRSSESFKDNDKNNNNPVIFNVSPSKKFEKQLFDKNKFYNKKKSDEEDEDDDSIVFEADGKNKKDNSEKIEEIEKSPSNIEKHRVFVFIQMEFCEGRTLKDLIDKELYKSIDRVWSLFREILQGLNHVHELVCIELFFSSN